jgi:hypothetical protein
MAQVLKVSFLGWDADDPLGVLACRCFFPTSLQPSCGTCYAQKCDAAGLWHCGERDAIHGEVGWGVHTELPEIA